MALNKVVNKFAKRVNPQPATSSDDKVLRKSVEGKKEPSVPVVQDALLVRSACNTPH
ncbi:hypothetical protein DM01DRAFT_1339344 [Hesseltinella vesiculosa]|uniref:Uncharacterized protein n=1 Tax=Hesseltinella vesiculosa TaxID=101127 RepID=A0A1X2G8M0_9FUNG|nr:hypothetical protein DM01DRAFT_1339344 [Hesseltinella vesiculosa]